MQWAPKIMERVRKKRLLGHRKCFKAPEIMQRTPETKLIEPNSF